MRRGLLRPALAAISALGVFAAWTPGAGRPAPVVVTLHPEETFIETFRRLGIEPFKAVLYPALEKSDAA